MPSQLQYLHDVRDFFAKYEAFLTRRISGLENDALGDSRYISQWLTYTIRANVQHASSKVAELEQTLTQRQQQHFAEKAQQFDATLSHYYMGGLNALLKRVGVNLFGLYSRIKRPTITDATLLKDMATAEAKATDYIARAVTVLAEQQWVTKYSTQTIPVKPHEIELKRVDECVDAYMDLKRQYPGVLANPQSTKSWLNKTLQRFRDLVKLRVISFAFEDNRSFKGHKLGASIVSKEQALHDLDLILNSDRARQKAPSKLPETNTSKRLHQSTEQPFEDDFIPNSTQLTAAFNNLRKTLKKAKDVSTLSFEKMNHDLTVEYPKHDYKLK